MSKPKIQMSSIIKIFFKSRNYKKIVLISIYLFVLIAIFALLYIIEKNGLKISMLNEKIQIITNLTILVSTLFAILYFDPFGLKSKVKFEQYNQITDLLRFFDNLGLIILVKNKSEISEFLWVDGIQNFKKMKFESRNKILNMNVLVNYSEYLKLYDKISEFKKNTITPNELKENINVSLLSGISVEFDDIDSEYIELKFGNLSEVDLNGNTDYAILTKIDQNPKKFISLAEFMDEYYSLDEKCENWLNSNKL